MSGIPYGLAARHERRPRDALPPHRSRPTVDGQPARIALIDPTGPDSAASGSELRIILYKCNKVVRSQRLVPPATKGWQDNILDNLSPAGSGEVVIARWKKPLCRRQGLTERGPG